MNTVKRISVSAFIENGATEVHITRDGLLNTRFYRNISDTSARRLEKLLIWRDQLAGAFVHDAHIYSEGVLLVWRRQGND